MSSGFGKIRVGLWMILAALLVSVSAEAAENGVTVTFAPAENGWTEVSDPEGLLRMEADPEGSYVLTSDIDMTGVEWYPFSFRGKLNGNGYSVLNLTITDAGESIRETYDGNMKVYDTYFSGFFIFMKVLKI